MIALTLEQALKYIAELEAERDRLKRLFYTRKHAQHRQVMIAEAA